MNNVRYGDTLRFVKRNKVKICEALLEEKRTFKDTYEQLKQARAALDKLISKMIDADENKLKIGEME